MATFSPQEVHFVTNGQSDITVSHPYIVGATELRVYLNGILALLGNDYVEVDEYTIRFNFQLSEDDVIVTEHKVYFDDKKITVIGKKAESIFQRYGDDKTLFENQKYTLTFRYEDQEFSQSFMTFLTPLYSTVKTVREDLGAVIEEIPDERILYLLFQNSILSQNIANEENLALLQSSEKVPFVFKQYVRYRTEVDLITSIYLLISGRQGSATKNLGTFKVDRRYQFNAIGLETILDDLKNKQRSSERALTRAARSSPLVGAVKGGTNNPYPLTTPRMGFVSGATDSE